ncbi:asparagine synthase-related protein [Nonomuraea sp. NPDC050394]|uniref:asparagine synthase-related protein n=1 Tax=Nonomuraea sp. NPDC050394 TaxID=3364363 RepID=UPI0037B21197
MSATEDPWFTVLPDREESTDVARRIHDSCGGAHEVSHPSGRPWLIGRWPPGALTVGRRPGAATAAFGEHAMSEEHLAAGAPGLPGPGPGSAYLMVSEGGRVRVRGTASGLRRVYTCRVGGTPVAGNRALVLAGLTGATPNPARLATRLLFAHPPWPLNWLPVWDGVDAVPPGHDVLLDERGGLTQARWWRLPEPMEREEAVAALRTALSEAVALRARPGRTVVAHLSGMDSSSICSLAARTGADVVALTAAQPDPMDEDVPWAERTAAALAAAGHPVRHEIISARECPLVYHDMLGAHERFDAPFLLLHHRSRLMHILRRGQAYAPGAHLVGLGGDEAATMMPTWLPTLIRQAPLTGTRHLLTAAAKNRWPLRQTLRHLVSGRAYDAWMRAAADGLGRDGHGVDGPALGWDLPPTMPAWATPYAVELAAGELREAAAGHPPLARGRGAHHNLAAIHGGCQMVADFQQIAAARGITMSAPFFDDRVIEAALSARPGDRYDPARYKPVLADAMRGIVPEVTLGRTTKSETSASAVMGSRKHRDQIMALAEDSLLGELGLIDRDLFRATCRGPIDVLTQHRRIEPTLACEMWLRTVKEDERVRAGA